MRFSPRPARSAGHSPPSADPDIFQNHGIINIHQILFFFAEASPSEFERNGILPVFINCMKQEDFSACGFFYQL